MHHNEQTAGAALGALLGFAKSLLLITTLSWGVILDTAILASVGAVCGWLATNLLKFLTKKFKSWKNTPKNN